MSDITRDYSFGGWVRHIRLSNQITLRAAASTAGMDAGNLSKIERSELTPPMKKESLAVIVKAIQASPDQEVLLKSLAFQHHLALLRKRFFT